MATFTAVASSIWENGLTWGSVNDPGTEGTDYPGPGDVANAAGFTISRSTDFPVGAGVTFTAGTLAPS